MGQVVREVCAHCGRLFPRELNGTWAVRRPDMQLECYVMCECGATLLLIHARVQTVNLVDLEDAKRWQLSDEDMERMAAGLRRIQGHIRGNLGVDKRRAAILREMDNGRSGHDDGDT